MKHIIKKKKIVNLFAVFGLNFLLAIFIIFLFCPTCFLSLEHLSRIWDDIFYSYILCLMLGYGNGMINNYLDKKVSWIHAPAKRLFLNVSAMLLYSFIASLMVVYIFINFIFEGDLSDITWQRYVEFTYVPIGITAVITTFLTSRGFLLGWREAAIEAERLKTESIASQYESLKSQVNPHFLFNSLNTLTALVYENPDVAAKFIKKLAEVYRYVLDTQNKEVVELKEELAFLDSYIFLQKMRYENNLQVNINLPDQRHIMIPPLSLQMLLENAIKHNEISEEKPLQIDLYLEDNEYIVMRNNLQIKNIRESSSGIGLNNIKSRYEYLSKKMVEVLSSTDVFVVKLPILHFKSL